MKENVKFESEKIARSLSRQGIIPESMEQYITEQVLMENF